MYSHRSIILYNHFCEGSYMTSYFYFHRLIIKTLVRNFSPIDETGQLFKNSHMPNNSLYFWFSIFFIPMLWSWKPKIKSFILFFHLSNQYFCTRTNFIRSFLSELSWMSDYSADRQPAHTYINTGKNLNDVNLCSGLNEVFN